MVVTEEDIANIKLLGRLTHKLSLLAEVATELKDSVFGNPSTGLVALKDRIGKLELAVAGYDTKLDTLLIQNQKKFAFAITVSTVVGFVLALLTVFITIFIKK